jgi:hypothetical protein
MGAVSAAKNLRHDAQFARPFQTFSSLSSWNRDLKCLRSQELSATADRVNFEVVEVARA